MPISRSCSVIQWLLQSSWNKTVLPRPVQSLGVPKEEKQWQFWCTNVSEDKFLKLNWKVDLYHIRCAKVCFCRCSWDFLFHKWHLDSEKLQHTSRSLWAKLRLFIEPSTAFKIVHNFSTEPHINKNLNYFEIPVLYCTTHVSFIFVRFLPPPKQWRQMLLYFCLKSFTKHQVVSFITAIFFTYLENLYVNCLAQAGGSFRSCSTAAEVALLQHWCASFTNTSLFCSDSIKFSFNRRWYLASC